MGRKEFEMAITSRELMQPPKFEGLGKFVYARPGSGEWSPTFVLEFFGGQVSIEVEDTEVVDPPEVGSFFHISGHVRCSQRNGSISLVATEKKFVAKREEELTSEQTDAFVGGLLIVGVGVVKTKESTQIGRSPAFLSATLGWQGSTYQFKKLTPEIFQRIPAPNAGKVVYVRFELSMLVRQERNNDGQLINLQIPSLSKIQLDNLVSGSAASSAASTAAGSGMSKPASVATAPGAKV
jgi:hypothetical protein